MNVIHKTLMATVRAFDMYNICLQMRYNLTSSLILVSSYSETKHVWNVDFTLLYESRLVAQIFSQNEADYDYEYDGPLPGPSYDALSEEEYETYESIILEWVLNKTTSRIEHVIKTQNINVTGFDIRSSGIGDFIYFLLFCFCYYILHASMDFDTLLYHIVVK